MFHTPFSDSLLATLGHDINTLELLTVMAALKLWGHLLRGQRFILKHNNVPLTCKLVSGRLGSCLPSITLSYRPNIFPVGTMPSQTTTAVGTSPLSSGPVSFLTTDLNYTPHLPSGTFPIRSSVVRAYLAKHFPLHPPQIRFCSSFPSSSILAPGTLRSLRSQ